ncbi:MAG: lactate racemase domain-containing protein [Planctomycetota bacterium]
MALYFSEGSATTELSTDDLRNALKSTFERLGERNRILAIPPDYTRANSRAGILTCLAYEHFGDRLVDVLPALGTHRPVSEEELNDMFPGLPHSLVREHDWRNDVLTIGHVPGEEVSRMTDGIFDRPWPAQLNKLLWEGGHDLILSIGQVVPHEVIGMANYNKNIFVGTGGEAGINEGHYIGAVYGMERMMGRADTPLRRILNYAEREFCSDLPLLYLLTVVGSKPDGTLVTRGLYIGDDPECFEAAAELSVQVNFEQLDKPLEKVVCYLDPKEFKSTWLGNKAVYRTRMAIADGGHLIVLGPAVKEFGEKEEIDALIRKYGYRTQEEIEKAVAENEDLRANLSAAAHLIHGSSEGRFRVTYCPGHLTREEIESVGYEYAELEPMLERYPIDRLNGYHETADGESYYYIHNPALGLWAHKDRLT